MKYQERKGSQFLQSKSG